MRYLSLVLLTGLIGVACGASASVEVVEARPTTVAVSESPQPSEPAAEPVPDGSEVNADATDLDDPPAASPEPGDRAEPASPTPNEFADLELTPAPVGLDALDLDALGVSDGPVPVAMAIDAIGVDDAAIIPVGVNDDQTFEVPPAEQVGWYRFGPSPGEAGSAVLAAHIAYDGVDGVFRDLATVEVGSIVTVAFDDGTTRRYRIESVTDYVKEELPAELFSRTGDAQLALITCGGAFNPQLRSYDSNTVAVAVPI